MFMSKDKPELYELLKTNKSKLGKLSAQEKDEQAISAPVTTPSDSEPIPYTTPSSSATSPYPKLRMPFPILKPKEPTDVFQKPQTKTARPPRPELTGSGKTEGQKIHINYPKIIVIGGVIVAIIVILYLALALPKTTPPTHGGTTQPADKAPETPPPPVPTGHTWSLRLIYYTNNAEGQRSLQNRLRFLNEKGISGVFTKNETIGGSLCTVIYKGKYGSHKEAKKDLPNLKKLHYTFKNADAVEVR